MTTLDDLVDILKDNLNAFKEKYDVQKFGIFGSYALGNQTESSDVDILVFYNVKPDWRHFRLNFELEDLLNKKVDLATINSLRENTKKNALKDVIYIEWLRGFITIYVGCY